MQLLAGLKVPAELLGVLRECRGYLLYAGLFSLGMNLLYLAAPLYTLQVYDRVLASVSVPTLVMLTLALVLALGTLAALDRLRTRIMVRAGIRIDNRLAPRIFDAIARQSLTEPGASRQQALRDLDAFRQFATGPGVQAAFDAPWTIVYLAITFLIHPLIGALSLFFAVLILALAVANEMMTRRALFAANESAARGYQFAESTLRNGEIISAMGLQARVRARWKALRDDMLGANVAGGDLSATVGAGTKFVRMVSQSLILAAAAWLVIDRSITVGAMFASVIILGRMMQPVEQAVAAWGQFAEARRAVARLARLLERYPEPPQRTELPAPAGKLAAEQIEFARGPGEPPVLDKVSFELAPGEALAVIGPTASGKTTLARLAVGVLKASGGAMRLDGADIAESDSVALGRYIGYLPQDVELLTGTVAENIARFEDAPDASIIAAAQLAGVHDMVLRLPKGYDTPIGENGVLLSGGQRQRVALARAVFGEPRLVVLDEPNSNLDVMGEGALAACLRALKERGVTVLLVTHRLGLVRAADKVLLLAQGRVDAYGPRHEVLQRLSAIAQQRRAEAPRPPIRSVP